MPGTHEGRHGIGLTRQNGGSEAPSQSSTGYPPRNPLLVFTIFLRYQNHHLPYDIVGKGPITKCHLHDGNHLQPVSGVCIFLPRRLLEPLVEVFRLHDQTAPTEVQV